MASAASRASVERVEFEAPGVYAQKRMGSEESMESVLPPWKRPRAAASAAPGVYAKECMGSEESMETVPPPSSRRAAASAASGADVQECMGSVESMESVPPPATRPHAAATGPAKPGDWICKLCGNLNFNRRGFCAGRRGRCGQSRDSNWLPGDWYCSCGNHNMAFRTHCNRTKCGLPRERGEQR